MSRPTHNRHTQNQKEPSTINIKTDDSVLKSLDRAKEKIGNIANLSDIKSEVVTNYIIIDGKNNLENQPAIFKILNVITNFLTLCQSIPSKYDENEYAIKQSDLFTSDVLHEFELGSPKDIGRA